MASHDTAIRGAPGRPRAGRARPGAEPRARPGAGRRGAGRGRRRAAPRAPISGSTADQPIRVARARPSVGQQGRAQAAPGAGRVRHHVRAVASAWIRARRPADSPMCSSAAARPSSTRWMSAAGSSTRVWRPTRGCASWTGPTCARSTALPGPAPDLVTLDLSFISLRLVMPAVVRLIAPRGADLVALFKPQFELGRDAIGKGGIVRDADRPRGPPSSSPRGSNRRSARCAQTADPIAGSRRQGQPRVAGRRTSLRELPTRAEARHERGAQHRIPPASRRAGRPSSPRSRGHRRADSRPGRRSRIPRLRCTSTARTPRCW